MNKNFKGNFKYNNKTIYYKVVTEQESCLDSSGNSLVAYYSKFKYIPTIFKNRIVLLSCNYLKYLSKTISHVTNSEDFMPYHVYSETYRREISNLNAETINYIVKQKIISELKSYGV